MNFTENMSFKRLFLYWLGFLALGIVLILVLTPLSPKFIEKEQQIIQNSCTKATMIETFLAPVLETVIFMVLPLKFFKKKGLIVGVVLWCLLHLVAKNIPIFLYICLMGLFYFKALEVEKYKRFNKYIIVVVLHGIINWVGVLTCFL